MERSCSAATSSVRRFSDCSFCSSSFSATICSRIASSCASWRVAASRVTRRWAALKSASGLDPSAEENCLSRSSRMRADCSSITWRSWCWTAAVEPSPNSRCSSLASCPSSGPNTSSTLVPKRSARRAPCRERPLDSPDTRSSSAHELGVHAPPARAPARARRPRSRRRSRAPGPRPPPPAAATKAAAAGSSTTTFSTITRPIRTCTRGWRSGVAASMATTHARAPGGRRSPLRPSGSSSRTSTSETSACPGLPRTNATIASTASARALEDGLHGAVGAVGAQPGDAAPLGLAARRVPEEDPLHAAPGDHVPA